MSIDERERTRGTSVISNSSEPEVRSFMALQYSCASGDFLRFLFEATRQLSHAASSSWTMLEVPGSPESRDDDNSEPAAS